MARYIPFPCHADMAPLDISYLFEDEKPAGKHGFLQVQGERFVFEDGTPIRFWGTNLSAGACFPEKPYAEKLAKRLASYGCNIVRLHQMDAEWGIPNIFQCRRGKRLSNTSTYDPESFDRLDYLIYCLKKEGIYVFLDMQTYRKYKEDDGARSTVLLKNNGAPYCLFDPTLIELQKEYMRALWLHHNPYTGIDYKDDPVFVMSDIINEACLYGCFDQEITVEPYVSEFRERFRLWCEENGYNVDTDALDVTDKTVPELNEFRDYLTHQYYDGMIDYMHSLGVKIPITGPNYTWKYMQSKVSQEVGDFMDNHSNLGEFLGWTEDGRYYRNWGFHERAEWGLGQNLRHRKLGKPFFNSEWDCTFPNKYRAESAILFASIGMLQNWSGFTNCVYAYSSFLENVGTVGKESSSCAIGGLGYREGLLSCWNDPAKTGMFYHGALITRREDVRPALNKIAVRVDEVETTNDCLPGGVTTLVKPAFDVAVELSQIGADYHGEFADAVPDDKCLVDLSSGEVRSDTGELYRSWEKRYGTVDTAKTKSVYGRLGRLDEIELNGMKVKCQNDYAVIAVSSLNNELDLENTDAMLLTAVGDVMNTDMKRSIAPDHKQKNDGMPPLMQMEDLGKAPILCEVIEAEVAIKTNRTNLVCWAVNAEGFFVGQSPIRYEDGYAVFNIGGQHSSIYYFIQAE